MSDAPQQDDEDLEYEDTGITLMRFLELVVIGIGSSIVILELIWTINDYREAMA